MKKFIFLTIAIVIGGFSVLSGQANERSIIKNPVSQGISAAVPEFSEIRFTENFDGAGRAMPDGWIETHSSIQEPPVMWDFDATPASPGYHSFPNCLNYNDGTDFDDGATNSGSVTTPPIDISGLSNVIVSFYYARQTEFVSGEGGPGDNIYDLFTIEILRASDDFVLQTLEDNYLAPTSAWLFYFFPCIPEVLQEDAIKVRFQFNTVDFIANNGFGVFIDDLVVGSEVPVVGEMYASTGQFGWLLEVDQLTGQSSAVMPINLYGPVTEVEAGPNGILWGTTGGGSANLLQINPMTQEINLVGTHPFGALNGLEFVGSTLYGTFYNPGNPTTLVTVNPTNAALTEVMTFNSTYPVTGLAYDVPSGLFYGLLSTSYGSSSPSVLISIDAELGTYNAIDICHLATGEPVALRGLDFSPQGLLYSGTPPYSGPARELAGGMLVLINPANALVTVVGPTGYPAISGVTFVETSPVPLADWAIFIAIGFILVSLVIRYRKV